MPRPRRLAAALAATLALGAAMTSQAVHASGSRCNPGCEAKVTYRSGKQHLKIRDKARDGHSAVGELQARVNGEWFPFNESGFWNSRGSDKRPKVVDLSGVRNGLRIRYRACVGDRPDRRVFDCSRKWRRDRA